MLNRAANHLFLLSMVLGTIFTIFSLPISASAEVKESPFSWKNAEKLEYGTMVLVEVKNRYWKGQVVDVDEERIRLNVNYLIRGKEVIEIKREEVVRVFSRAEPKIENRIKIISAIPLKAAAAPVGFAVESGEAFWYGDGRYNLLEILKFGVCGATHGLQIFPKEAQKLADTGSWTLTYSINSSNRS